MKTIKATDETIHEIVKSEIERPGNEADLNHIDVSEVTNMEAMFSVANFNGDISKWNVSNVEDMGEMFNDSIFNGDLSKWKLKDGVDIYALFLNSPITRKNYTLDLSCFTKEEIEKMFKI